MSHQPSKRSSSHSQFVRDDALLSLGQESFKVGAGGVGKNCSVCRSLEMLPLFCPGEGCGVPLCQDCAGFHAKTCDSCVSHVDLRTMPVCPVCTKSVTLPTPSAASATRQDAARAIEDRVARHVESGCRLFVAAKRSKGKAGRCGARGCKNKMLLGGCACDGCEVKHCMTHRFPADHKCKSLAATSAAAQARAGPPAGCRVVPASRHAGLKAAEARRSCSVH